MSCARTSYANERQNTFLINNNRSVFLTFFALHYFVVCGAMKMKADIAVWVTADCAIAVAVCTYMHQDPSSDEWKFLHTSPIAVTVVHQLFLQNWIEIHCSGLVADVYEEMHIARLGSFHFLIAEYACTHKVARFASSAEAERVSVFHSHTHFMDIIGSSTAAMQPPSLAKKKNEFNIIHFLLTSNLITIIYSERNENDAHSLLLADSGWSVISCAGKRRRSNCDRSKYRAAAARKITFDIS